MTWMLRTVAEWTGFVGGPGYTNMYWTEFTDGTPPTLAQAQAASDTARAFFDSAKGALPTTVTIRMRADVDVLEDTTGALTGSLVTTPLAAVVGTASVAGGYSATSGACITLRTSEVRNGRRVRGRFFLVPMGGTQYGPDGTLADAGLTNLRTYANNLIAVGVTPRLSVWARPTAPGASDGEAYTVTSTSVPDMAAVLRSRRD